MKSLLQPVGLDSARTVTLPPVLGMREAGPLRDEILAARGHMLDLDGASVERLGGLGLQVLLSAQATWRRDGVRLRLVQPSGALAEGLALFGAKQFDSALSEGASL